MEGEKQKFKDKSSDKKYFTTVPNMIVNGYSAVESGVYLYIKKRAGENGQLFETAGKIAKSLKISKPTYLKIRNKFEKDGIIKFVGWKEGKTHPVKVYEVVDIWGINMGRYEKKGKKENLSFREKGKLKNFRKVKNTTTNNNPLEEKLNTNKNQLLTKFKNFNLDDERRKLVNKMTMSS